MAIAPEAQGAVAREQSVRQYERGLCLVAAGDAFDEAAKGPSGSSTVSAQTWIGLGRWGKSVSA